MPKKDWSPEERKALGDRLKAAREAKQAERESQKQKPLEIKKEPEEKETLSLQALDIILERLEKLETGNLQANADKIKESVTPLSISDDGMPSGILVKYPLNKSAYPDPTPELMADPFFKRWALSDNYLLKWDVTAMQYETKYGTTVAEPKFVVALYAKMFDDEGEETDRLIRLQSLTIFEDPGSVKQLIVELGIDTQDLTDIELFNLVRYHRIREWLKGFFQPAKNVSAQQRSIEEVIDGRVVVIEEKSSVLGL